MKKKTYHIIIIGCQMNKSDSERIASYLEKYGYIFSDNKEKADLVVVTTCGVRQSAEDRVYGLIPRIKRLNPKSKIILTGCLSGREDVRGRLKKYVDIWLPITELKSLAGQLGLKKINEKNSLSGYLAINPKYNSRFSAFVPIGNGCNNYCAYCVVPYARGKEVYRPAEEIIAEVKNLVKKGYKEIILIAQNVNSYQSIKSKVHKVESSGNITYFPELLRMVNGIKGDFWIRFATSHPKDMSDGLIKAIKDCDKVCGHIHLPVQAGDNEVLRRMNRKYTREHYLDLIVKTRKILNSKQIKNQKSKISNSWIPPVSITTDIIVGFPGETKKQFNQTAKLFREVKFALAYVAQYSPRPGTASARMKDNIPKKEKKRREEDLVKILRNTALAENKKYIGKTVEVLVDGRNKRGEWFGKTRTYKNVRITETKKQKNKKANLLGRFAKIKINKVEDFGMEGCLV